MANQAVKSRVEDGEDTTALLATLDSLRSAITIFDSGGRLIYANAHLNYLFRSFPPRETLIGKTYQELIRLEIEGGEIASEALAGGVKSFIARRLAQLRPEEFSPRDVALCDHRVVDGIVAARALNDLEAVLRGTIAAELKTMQSNRAAA